MDVSLDPRLPVLVGVGQLTIPSPEPEKLEPADLMAEALRRAERDAGVAGLLRDIDQLLTVNQLSWRYRNDAVAVANRIGAQPRRLATSVVGGNFAGVMMARAAKAIYAGECDSVAICGGEATRTRTRFRANGETPPWSTQDENVLPAEVIGDSRPMVDEAEIAAGVQLPIHVYPLFEVALRAQLGLSVDDHRRRMGNLAAAFASVAANNPYAWIRNAPSADEIVTPSESNRMISTPYTKYLVSNNQVDQGGAVLILSVAEAQRRNISPDRWVFFHSASEAIDHWHVSNRINLHSSPALHIAGRNAYAMAGITPHDIAHADLYSCFTSAVQIGARELQLLDSDHGGWGGIGARIPLTTTGGMTFAGGPFNNYTTHGVATMTNVLRNDPGTFGLCTANGGYTTEHAVLLLSTTPPRNFGYSNPQAEVDALPFNERDETFSGEVEIESATVIYENGSPQRALIAALTTDSKTPRRSWCWTDDISMLNEFENTECVGRKMQRQADGKIV